MMKRGLGKGLEAFFPTQSDTKREEIAKEEVTLNNNEVEIDINKIIVNKEQPRKTFNEKSLNELSQSIKKYGIIQPIIVIEKDDKYEIVAGERRYRAAMKAELKKIPAIIKKYDTQTKNEIALIENIQREDLNILEKAQAFKDIIDTNRISQEELSNKIGKSRSSISNTIRLLKLSDKIKEYISKEELSEGHCKVLLAIEDKQLQENLANKVVEKGLSVRQLEEFVKNINEPKDKKNSIKTKKDVWIEDIEDKFKNFFQTKVEIKHHNNKGKIILEYYSNDELDRILDIINGR